MKLRIFVITALLVGGFLFITSQNGLGTAPILQPVSSSVPLWSGPSPRTPPV